MKFFLICLLAILLFACSSSKKVASINTDKEINIVPTQEVINKVKKEITKTKRNTKENLNKTTLAYILQYAPLAMEEMRKFKIPASITLAQGILESGSGKSKLALKSNNHFGIKCHKEWKGARVYYDDDAKGECFRQYKYAATSYQDHSIFLVTRFRYASLFKLRKDDYKSWAKGLKKAGYATDSKYPKKLISFIEKYDLYKYDQLVLKGKIKFKNKISTTNIEELSKKNKPIKKINKRGIHVVKDDDTLYSISRTYGVTIDNLKLFNNLSDNTIYEKSELKLRATAKRNSYHVVKKKETLYTISKKYNTTVEQLKKINELSSDDLSIGHELKIQ